MASRRTPHTPSKTEPTPASVETNVAPAKTTRARKSPAKTPPAPRSEISEDMRRSMIAQAAYLRAERRGFSGGSEVDDWLAAEAEVDALLKAEADGTPQ